MTTLLFITLKVVLSALALLITVGGASLCWPDVRNNFWQGEWTALLSDFLTMVIIVGLGVCLCIVSVAAWLT